MGYQVRFFAAAILVNGPRVAQKLYPLDRLLIQLDSRMLKNRRSRVIID